MAVFITWLVEDDESFRSRYLAVTGEGIQAEPAIHANDDEYMVGSSRISQEEIDLLKSEFPDMYAGSEPPEWWVQKVVQE